MPDAAEPRIDEILEADPDARLELRDFPAVSVIPSTLFAEMQKVHERVGDDVFYLAVDYTWFHYQDYPVGEYEKRAVAFAEFAIRNGWKK